MTVQPMAWHPACKCTSSGPSSNSARYRAMGQIPLNTSPNTLSAPKRELRESSKTCSRQYIYRVDYF
jgi:hypothetical protein